jgi:PhnB protein
MNLSPSVGLHFDGECREAFELYARLFNMQLELVLPWGASPLASRAPAGWGDKILFARLRGRALTLLGADALPGTYVAPAGFTLTLQTLDAAEAERFFTELATGGAVAEALTETFWAVLYGVVVDRFGIPWEITCRRQPAAE